MKFNITKGELIYLSFVWGLWVTIICAVIDGLVIWNMGYTFFFTLHIMANLIVLWLSIIRGQSLEEEE